VRTVESILAHTRSQQEQIKWVNRPDTDGWTALCWALRPCEDLDYVQFYGEPYDLMGTVQSLLEAGADLSISCRMGREDERFTVLELAQLHSVPAEVIRLLSEPEVTNSTENKSVRLIEPYSNQIYGCSICLNVSDSLLMVGPTTN
jgi:hypothetical protein